LQVQTRISQASVGHESLKQATEIALAIELTMDLHIVQLPEGSLHIETSEERAHLFHMKDLSLNLAMLPILTLHELHQGVLDEI